MSVDKLVDSTQLDADLTSVANAIRTKGGTSASLAFPADFVQAIGDIPTGGGGDEREDLEKMMAKTLSSYESSDDFTSISTEYALAGCTSLQSVILPNVTYIATRAFLGCSSLTTLKIPQFKNGGVHLINGTHITVLVLPNFRGNNTSSSQAWRQCTTLSAVDYAYVGGSQIYGINGDEFNGCSALNTVILRAASVWKLGNKSAFTGTPFASGGTGGTIYIPKALYDHLGDGGSLDYKAATNWSAVNGYGTITWAQIEGSQYENYYADGTPIPTT